MNFGERLKELRNEKHISQEELADILWVSRQTISRWESRTNDTRPILSRKDLWLFLTFLWWIVVREEKRETIKVSRYSYISICNDDCHFIFLTS